MEYIKSINELIRNKSSLKYKLNKTFYVLTIDYQEKIIKR